VYSSVSMWSPDECDWLETTAQVTQNVTTAKNRQSCDGIESFVRDFCETHAERASTLVEKAKMSVVYARNVTGISPGSNAETRSDGDYIFIIRLA